RRERRGRIDDDHVAVTAKERERLAGENALAALERDRVPEPELDGEGGSERLEDVHPRELSHELDDPRRRLVDVEDVEAARSVVESRLARPLRERRAGAHLPAEEIADQRAADADLGGRVEPRGNTALGWRHPHRLELHHEIAERELSGGR